jgi:formylglycine-generating enzyme required for sulfatase activity
MSPLEGLVPVGVDRASGLHEFALIDSGAVPLRGPGGALVLDGDSAAVLVLLPPGRFVMGSSYGFADERPVREVEIPGAFLLGKHEVSQAQWLRVMGSNPSGMKPEGPVPGVTLRHPVEQIDWFGAGRFALRLGCVLPTEARWEYACRATTTTTWWTGDEAGSLQGAANLADKRYKLFGGPNEAEPWDDGAGAHAPIGRSRPNLFGLHDMTGNVFEWCLDDFVSGYSGAPVDGRARVAPKETLKVARGGSWGYLSGDARSAYRESEKPANRSVYYGLRIAREVE